MLAFSSSPPQAAAKSIPPRRIPRSVSRIVSSPSESALHWIIASAREYRRRAALTSGPSWVPGCGLAQVACAARDLVQPFDALRDGRVGAEERRKVHLAQRIDDKEVRDRRVDLHGPRPRVVL